MIYALSESAAEFAAITTGFAGYLVLLVVYVGIWLVTLMQLVRILGLSDSAWVAERLSRLRAPLMSSKDRLTAVHASHRPASSTSANQLVLLEHVLVLCITSCRACAMAILYRFASSVSFATLSGLSLLPLVMNEWVYGFVIFQWSAAIYYNRAEGWQRRRLRLLVALHGASAHSLLCHHVGGQRGRWWGLYAGVVSASMADGSDSGGGGGGGGSGGGSTRSTTSTTSTTTSHSQPSGHVPSLRRHRAPRCAVIALLASLLFTLGLALVYSLTRDFASKHATKLFLIAATFSCTLLGQAVTLMHQAAQPHSLLDNINTDNSFYYALDAAGAHAGAVHVQTIRAQRTARTTQDSGLTHLRLRPLRTARSHLPARTHQPRILQRILPAQRRAEGGAAAPILASWGP